MDFLFSEQENISFSLQINKWPPWSIFGNIYPKQARMKINQWTFDRAIAGKRKMRGNIINAVAWQHPEIDGNGWIKLLHSYSTNAMFIRIPCLHLWGHREYINAYIYIYIYMVWVTIWVTSMLISISPYFLIAVFGETNSYGLIGRLRFVSHSFLLGVEK